MSATSRTLKSKGNCSSVITRQKIRNESTRQRSICMDSEEIPKLLMDGRMDDMVRGLIVSLLKKREKEDIKTFYLLLFFNFIYSIEENYEKIS